MFIACLSCICESLLNKFISYHINLANEYLELQMGKPQHPTSPLHLLAFNEPNRPRPSQTLLGPSRTGYGRFGQQMFRMGLATDHSCSCGCAVQTAHHAIYDCPITRCPGDITTLDLRARDWLHTTQLNM